MTPHKPKRAVFYLVVLLCFAFFRPAFGEIRAVDPDSERFMEVVLNQGRDILASAVPLYRMKGSAAGSNQQDLEWYFPLGEYAEALGFPIEVSAAVGLAEGFIISESRRFNFNLSKCTVEYSGTNESFPCDEAVLYQREIWIPQHLIERWFPVTVNSIDLLGARIAITPREKLPIQARLDRERQASRAQGEGVAFDPGYPRIEIPYSLIEGPFFDPSFQLGRMTAGGTPNYLVQYNSPITGELLGLETRGFFGGSNGQIDGGRLSFARRDPAGGLLGPLGVRQLRFNAVDFPAIPLLTGGMSGLGFFISSFRLDIPTSFDRNDFQGLLAPGWEVVLYRNEILVGRQLGNNEGRYFFKNIALYYGSNVFRLSFFGPHGERRDEYKTFNIASSFITPGAGYYSFGWVTTERQEQRLALLYTKSLHKFISFTGGMLHSPIPKSTAISLGLIGVNELFLFSSSVALSENGGRAFEWGVQTGRGSTTLGAKHTRLMGLQSDLFGDDQTEIGNSSVNLGFSLWTNPVIGTNFEVLKQDFSDRRPQNTVRNRTAIGLGLINLNHDANFQIGSEIPYSGSVEASFGGSASRFRLEGGYIPSKFRSLTSELDVSLEDLNLGFSAQYQFDVKTFTVQTSANVLLTDYSLGLLFAFRNSQNFSVNTRISFSLQRDPYEGKWNLQRDGSSQTGAASVLVYYDKNRNDQRDEGEPPAPGVFLALNQQEQETATDEAGGLFLSGLNPQFPLDLSVTDRSFRKDPFIKPSRRGVRFFPRLGKTARVEFGLVTIGMVDGMVNLRMADGDAPKRGVQLELRSAEGKVVAQVKTDRYGLYNLEDLAPGEYRLSVSPEQLQTLKVRSEPAFQEISISDEGTIENGKDFLLTPR